MNTTTNNDTIPQHIAIVMDGNGRWASLRNLPRGPGHKAGVKTLRKIAEHCVRINLPVLTVFAFSSENWHRPKKEVDFLMELFLISLRDEVDGLHNNNVRLEFIGSREGLPIKLTKLMAQTAAKTENNTGLSLVIAANYGGRWDITQACKQIAEQVDSGVCNSSDISEELIKQHLSLANFPEPDLFIRTGGEQRISNYLLWQCAYSEIYFCDELWPEFSSEVFDRALAWFAGRQRRFGRTNEQIKHAKGA